MSKVSLYYNLKPYLPWRLRVAMRRMIGQRRLHASKHVWPVNETAGIAPDGWTGWPGGKKFAIVLTHDVEGPRGVAKCRQLMQLEQKLGFRSSFNFVPEGDYRVSQELREELTKNEFEVGVHDLNHDGKLYRSRDEFAAKAKRINSYLKEWGACGFRSGFMHHNVDWAHVLKIKYDCSTFDTDPFEPQPDGVNTIFPFWISPPSDAEPPASNLVADPGYAELPYTLPQDFTMYIILKERGPETWKKKLDWIADRGGMALVNVHPDYMNFGGSKKPWEYPASYYESFLQYVAGRYAGKFWHALPREVAELTRKSRGKLVRPAKTPTPVTPAAAGKPKPCIWIDLDNTPHVPLFEPIIRELKQRGYPVTVTARDAFQVCALADQKGLEYLKVGRHHGKHKLIKALGLLYRALQLVPAVRARRPALAVSHGARAQVIASKFLGIPSVVLTDYEFAKAFPLTHPDWVMVPEVIPNEAIQFSQNHIKKYPGIKEDVYVPFFEPNPALLGKLGVREGEMVITVRPPATEAHYHNPESEILFAHFMKRAVQTHGARIVLLPRNQKQKEWIMKEWPEWFAENKTIIPGTAVDGLNLLWHSDLVVSGGGTMNREAAAIGVPVYSIFRGPIGAVDHYLQREGRLILIESTADVDQKITLTKRNRSLQAYSGGNQSMARIIQHLEDILAEKKRS